MFLANETFISLNENTFFCIVSFDIIYEISLRIISNLFSRIIDYFTEMRIRVSVVVKFRNIEIRCHKTFRVSGVRTPKLAGQTPEIVSHTAIYHRILRRTSSRYQIFEQLLWEPSEDASQKSSWNQMSLPIRAVTSAATSSARY